VVGDAFPDAIHVLDTGNFTVVGEHVLRASRERNVFGTPNGRSMGFGLGYALGAAVASADHPVVLWIGDGGIRAFLAELNLAVAHRLELLVMVMSDGHFGSIRGRAIKSGWCTEPLQMDGRDLRRIAEAMGLDALAVDGEDELADGLASWRSHARPRLIRCDFDPEEYMSVADLLR
jgi:acetolactate synthase-1/2/3 large subunit